jgi:hypothetical protein
MIGVLNETTGMVHREGTAGGRTACGAATHLDGDRLRSLRLDRALEEYDASKCGRCFDDGGGY